MAARNFCWSSLLGVSAGPDAESSTPVASVARSPPARTSAEGRTPPGSPLSGPDRVPDRLHLEEGGDPLRSFGRAVVEPVEAGLADARRAAQQALDVVGGGELETLIELSYRLGFLTRDQESELENLCSAVGQMLTRLRQSLEEKIRTAPRR